MNVSFLTFSNECHWDLWNCLESSTPNIKRRHYHWKKKRMLWTNSQKCFDRIHEKSNADFNNLAEIYFPVNLNLESANITKRRRFGHWAIKRRDIIYFALGPYKSPLLSSLTREKRSINLRGHEDHLEKKST